MSRKIGDRLDYKTNHYRRLVTVYRTVPFWERIKILFGRPVTWQVGCRYPPDHETPINSTICDVISVINLNPD